MLQTVFRAARRCYLLFQLLADPQAPTWPALAGQTGFNALFRLGELGLLVLDLRSERTQRQVLSPASWDVVFAALDATHGLRHLLVIHPDLTFAQEALDVLPGRQTV